MPPVSKVGKNEFSSWRNVSFKIEDSIGRAASSVARCYLTACLVLLPFYLVSQNGCLDSSRQKEAALRSDLSNPVKVVDAVGEAWTDATLTVGFDGYNPHVARHILFKDGSETSVSYRTAAWQPFRRWIQGDEFDPKLGERYEVGVRSNALIRRVQ